MTHFTSAFTAHPAAAAVAVGDVRATNKHVQKSSLQPQTERLHGTVRRRVWVREARHGALCVLQADTLDLHHGHFGSIRGKPLFCPSSFALAFVNCAVVSLCARRVAELCWNSPSLACLMHRCVQVLDPQAQRRVANNERQEVDVRSSIDSPLAKHRRRCEHHVSTPRLLGLNAQRTCTTTQLEKRIVDFSC